MGKYALFCVLTVLVLLGAAGDGQAENWIRLNTGSRMFQEISYDEDSIRLVGTSMTWTVKYTLSKEGREQNTRELAAHEQCRRGLAEKGELTHFQGDYVSDKGKYRLLAIRNYTRQNELLCTDRDMGNAVDREWTPLTSGSAAAEIYGAIIRKYNSFE